MYASVILPLPVQGNFTYAVPEALQECLVPGMRVIVPFGKRHFYTGIVESLSETKPTGMEVKEISLLLDDHPIVRGPALKLWHWIASYYLCTVGEVMNAALPSALKLESQTRLQIAGNFAEEAVADCSEAELAILEALRRREHASVKDLEKDLGTPGVGATVTRMLARGLLGVDEKLVERFRCVRKPYVSLTFARGDQAAAAHALESLRRSPRQEEMLVAVMALSEFAHPERPEVEVPLEALLERTGGVRATVRALADKGLVRIYAKEISRFSYDGPTGGALPSLSGAQSTALAQIEETFTDKDITLLHGVTSSGKTEIYIHLIARALQRGEQALLLVPEIALTTQLTRRLQAVFGDKVVIYHSKFSDNERVEIWRRILRADGPLVAIGARSAVFLPFGRLGLVIVDEEHESSYKQHDPAPRYNGRDAATVLARMHGAKTLFGSATPAIETYYKAQSGQFGLVSLTERYAGVPLPEIEIVDIGARRSRTSGDALFSARLAETIDRACSRGRQAILFHNRRGYAPMARCAVCGFTPKCDHCDVSLTYHRRAGQLRCHYCGSDYQMPHTCPQCGEPAMEIVGFGTERLEDELDDKFHGRRVLRMDLDTTRVKEGYSKIIDEFSEGRADILVGTQMVTKGLDFGAVEVVGVINADSLINFPDFRAAERAFNMLEQVAGRAGRRDGSGRVVVQTYKPQQPLLEFVRRHDYTGFYASEIEERRSFGFPPFCRVVNIYLKHRDARTVQECAEKFAGRLRESLGARVLGPQEPPVGRVQNQYIRRIMLKIDPSLGQAAVKERLRSEYIALAASPLMKGLTVYYDVDPV